VPEPRRRLRASDAPSSHRPRRWNREPKDSPWKTITTAAVLPKVGVPWLLLSVSTLAGLALVALTDHAWLDPVAGFIIAMFAVKEGREAWEGELVCDHD
jgi:hypothetical protein